MSEDNKCATPKLLLPGLHLQIYIDGFKGSVTRGVKDAVSRIARDCPTIVSGVIVHDFPKNSDVAGLPRDLVRRMSTLRHEVLSISKDIQWSASYGLDGSKDHDATALTAVEKGERMADVSLACGNCVTVADAEGKWDTDQGPSDDMDEAGALAMLAAFRRRAPDSVMVDQPWPMIDQHGQNRRLVRPISEGGSFAGFPVDEFATLVVGRYPQAYWANWYGSHGSRAYSYVIDWMNREWQSVEGNMRKLDPRLVKPRFTSIQGYGHDSYPWTVLRHLIAQRGGSTIVWCDPVPTPGFWEILLVAEFVYRSAADLSLTPEAWVRELQQASGLSVDGVVGPKTWSAIVARFEAATRVRLVAVVR